MFPHAVIHAQGSKMNTLQGEAVDICVNGHNLCLTGQAGTGKTFTVQRIQEAMESLGKSATITCTTGMACMQYRHAQTIHSWAGLQDGRYSTEELIHMVENNERFAQCKRNISTAQFLVIDEISMLSKVLFEQLEAVCRAVRKNDTVFGGLQVLSVGDFYQLQPVPSWYGDSGEVCMTSAVWKLAFPHQITLVEVVWQQEEPLIRAVRELARGEPSSATDIFIKQLSRPLSPAVQEVEKLFPKNVDVEFENDQMLAKHEGESFTFDALDTGDVSQLRKFKIQKKLILKKGCPVVLMTNLTNPLLNGLQGRVVNVDSTGPVVHFQSVNITKKMEMFRFSKYDQGKKVDTASRTQFPLKLAYALTIHRSQGMTLDAVEVECSGAWRPGQIAVAIGRATSSERLRVSNYHPSLAPKPAEAIQRFYEQAATTTTLDLPASTCCKSAVPDTFSCQNLIYNSDNDSEYSHFGPLELEETEKIFHSLDEQPAQGRMASPTEPAEPPVTSAGESSRTQASLLPDAYDPEAIIRGMIYPSPTTEEQRKCYKVADSVLATEEKYQHFALSIFTLLTDSCNRAAPTKRTSTLSTKEINKFNAGVFQIINKEKDTFKILFPEMSDDQKTFCAKFILESAKCLLKWKATLVEKTEISETRTMKTMSADGKGKVRYVGGMCVAKLKYKFMRAFRNNIHSGLKKNRELANRSKEHVSMLKLMETSYAELAAKTKFPESLFHTQRKQNERCSLTNISDESLEFFLELENQRVQHSTKQAAHEERENVLNYVTQQVIVNKTVESKFMDAISDAREVCDERKKELYVAVTQKYMNVGNNQFRKELLSAFSKKKKLAHRIQIFTIGKETTRKEDDSAQQVKSTGKRKGKGKGKGKSTKRTKTSELELFFCPKCGKLYEDGDAWIACGRCEEWYDRPCSGVKSDSDWAMLCSTDNKWLCENCST